MATLQPNWGAANNTPDPLVGQLDVATKERESIIDNFGSNPNVSNALLVAFVSFVNAVDQRLVTWVLANLHSFTVIDGKLAYNDQVISPANAFGGAPTPAAPAAALPGGSPVSGGAPAPSQGASGLPPEAVQVYALATAFHNQFGSQNTTVEQTMTALLVPLEQIVQVAAGGNVQLAGTFLNRMSGTTGLRIRPDGRLEVEHLYDDARANLTAVQSRYHNFEGIDQDLHHPSVTASARADRLRRMTAIARGQEDPLVEQLQRELAESRRRVGVLESFIRYVGRQLAWTTITKVTRPSTGRFQQPETADVRAVEESVFTDDDKRKLADPANQIPTPPPSRP